MKDMGWWKMMSQEYYGSITHTEETIHILFHMRYRIYYMNKVIALGAVGLLLAAMGWLLALPMWLEGCMLLIGCILFVGREFPATVQAERVLDVRKGQLPIIHFAFREEEVQISEQKVKKNIPYQDFEHLVEYQNYLFCFLNENSVFMVERETLNGNDEKIMSFMEKSSGLHWEKPISLLTLNLQDLLRIWDRHKRKK